ncbi:FtsX-like permease family protein [Croceicoccus sp. F390]|uniref:FtsX-like permease family protein n=1 Tax=Croceicoccus esteveae TaxID=3075597 RepID=A0ABU2ZFH8_9SPHN|nr:FtsX-like permease family protein [Croceicoccus sp. F390]MDT0574833.1 FtsX-like permease family protein [Croceicoccus sp. F390]
MAAALARRDFSWRFRGLRLLVICLFLGSGALAAINTLEGAIRQQLAGQGQEILGGDIEFSRYARPAQADELAAMAALGQVSSGMRLQAIAVAGDRTAPVQLKSVDARWPLYGQFRARQLIAGVADSNGAGGAVTAGEVTAGAPAPMTAWAGQGALDRLGVQPGDSVKIGNATVLVAGVIAQEPDRLSEGFALGPPVIVSDQTLAATGLVQFGSMAVAKYRIALPDGANLQVIGDTFQEQFASQGWSVRTRDRAAPGADRLLESLGQFLSLVGLAALIIAGIGIAGAVASWLDSRRGTMATLKVLGADSTDVLRIHALQIAAATVVGVSAGLLAGMLVVPLLARLLADLLPVSGVLVFDIGALARAGVFALLVAFVFSAPALIASRTVTAMALLRARVSPMRHLWRRALLPVGLGLAGIVVLTLLTAHDPLLAAGFLGSTAIVLALLALIGVAVRMLASSAYGHTIPLAMRMSMGALGRPGAPTVALVTALGFGLSAFAAIAVIQTGIDAYVAGTVPERAPDYFVLDLPRENAAAFAQVVESRAPGTQIRTAPALRGAVLAYGPEDDMVRVADLDEIPEGAWALRGERGLTYSATLPPGNRITQGRWWPQDYTGEALVSIDDELAVALELEIGDMITIGLLGVERTARIASFRTIEWDDFGFNHALIFSPGSIENAPHNLAASLILRGEVDRAGLLGALVRQFPGSAVIEIGPVLGQARALLGNVGAAVLAAASVTVLAGLAVLLGAIAAARARETYDTIVLRVLGASRGQILSALAVRYLILAALLSAIALALGAGVGWYVMTGMFDLPFRPDWLVVAAVLTAGALTVVMAAVVASLPVLRARPAQALRDL